VFQLDVGPLPRIERIAEACAAMDEFARAAPLRQPDAPA
jgi:hypothetical protein